MIARLVINFCFVVAIFTFREKKKAYQRNEVCHIWSINELPVSGNFRVYTLHVWKGWRLFQYTGDCEAKSGGQ